jgi:hypothetical protein
MIFKSSEVPNTLSKWELNKPLEDAEGERLKRLKAIELIIGLLFSAQY